MCCVLRASGTNFDVDSFLRDSPIEALTVFRRGEVRFPDSKTNQRKCEHSGMHVSVSTREFSDLTGQIEDAIGFLTNNHEELRRLAEFAGLEQMDLDFPIEARDVMFQSDSFPPNLLSIMGALRIGLVISRYPSQSSDR